MDVTTTAQYRVLGYPHKPTQLVLMACDETNEELQDLNADTNLHDVDDEMGDGDNCSGEDTARRDIASPSIDKFEPIYIDMTEYDTAIQSKVDTLELGYLIEATVKWTADGLRLTVVDVIAETNFIFITR